MWIIRASAFIASLSKTMDLTGRLNAWPAFQKLPMLPWGIAPVAPPYGVACCAV
ncbi:hypothetical protein SAMCFNEI73_Ch2036 [Sinorhizobium americanum]|uniref:Uncharacterized protein n=1 Tax=Sinorhizobium americanum TaxID=194963 RepID=A0A1L3LMJ1_9HYPH|nr:hypothetical protein SAMCFNEI73_Ch2036 [Sinorhizobium americanum]